MAQSLLVESKKSNLRVSDQFAEVAKIRGSAEENIQRANAQAAQIQANAKVQSIEKWKNVTDKLANHFSNKATEGRIEAGRQKGQELVKKAMETNSFVPRYESEENILGFGKGKRHDEEANKSIDAYNSLLLANTINSAYNQANSEALVPENRQAVMDNLHGVYGGLVEKLEEMGHDDLAINARFLAADKLYALNNDMAKRQFAEMGDKMRGGLLKSLYTDPHATTIEGLKQQEAGYRLADDEIRSRNGTGILTTISGINAIQSRRDATFEIVGQKIKMGGIENILPHMDEMADPTTGTILTAESIPIIEDELKRVGDETVKAALAIGVQYTPEQLKQLRLDTLGGISRILYERSVGLEEQGIVAGNTYEPAMVKFIMAQEKDKGETAIEELAGLISDPVARSEWMEKQKDELYKYVNKKEESIFTAKAEKDTARQDALKAVVKDSLMPAVQSVRGDRGWKDLDDDELGYEIVYDLTDPLYGDPNGIKPTRGQWGYFISNRIKQLGFEDGSREAREYRRIGWKRYNSTIAPFSEIAAQNGHARTESAVHVQQMDGDKALTDESGAPLTKPVILNEEGLNNLSKAPAIIIEDATIAILSDPKKKQDAVDVIKVRNNALPLNPTSRYAKMAYALIAGVPFEEGMEAVDISKSSNFVKSIAADTGFSLLDAQSYSFMRNLGQRNEKQEKTDASDNVNYIGLAKVELDTAYKDGIFLPLGDDFNPADSDDFNEAYGDDFDGVEDLLIADPRALLTGGVLDETTEAYIKDELDSWGSDISIKAIGHANGFQTITYQLFDNENGVILPGEYTVDLRSRQ